MKLKAMNINIILKLTPVLEAPKFSSYIFYIRLTQVLIPSAWSDDSGSSPKYLSVISSQLIHNTSVIVFIFDAFSDDL